MFADFLENFVVEGKDVVQRGFVLTSENTDLYLSVPQNVSEGSCVYLHKLVSDDVMNCVFDEKCIPAE